MSIKSELQRISEAKAQLKEAIVIRGAQVQDADTIDTYAVHLASCPYTVRGTFTPEEDTQSLSIRGLPFAPKVVHFYCPEVETEKPDKGIRFLSHGDGVTGCAAALNLSQSTWHYNFLSKNSSLASWYEDGYEIDLSGSANMKDLYYFLAGYTYEYYISGGYTE